MARKVDAEADAASKAILDQLQTKTVGAPPSSTGLIGDQLPETIFDADTFDQVKNQITLQLTNLELLNVLNTIGQITNTQSQSGPLPDQQQMIQVDNTDSNFITFFSPPKGQCWLYVAGSRNSAAGVSGNVTTEVDIYNPNTDVRVLFIDMSSTSTSDFPLIETNPGGPIYISHPNVLRVKAEGTFTNCVTSHSIQRVR